MKYFIDRSARVSDMYIYVHSLERASAEQRRQLSFLLKFKSLGHSRAVKFRFLWNIEDLFFIPALSEQTCVYFNLLHRVHQFRECRNKKQTLGSFFLAELAVLVQYSFVKIFEFSKISKYYWRV